LGHLKPMAYEPTPARTHESAAPARVSAETLFRVHGSFVATFLRRLGAGADEIDDIVQDVFVVVHRQGGFVPGAAHPKTWLAEIGLRKLSSARRTARRRRTAPVPGEFFAAIPAREACPFEAAASAQGLRRVQRAIDEMDLVQRTVFILFEVEGDSCDSIAAAMRVPVGTIHSRLHAARRSFRNAYTRLDQKAGAESRSGEPVRLRDDPSLSQEGRLEIARFAVAAYPTFDVAHGLARFRASAHAPPSAPPHVFAGGAGAHPCAIAVSLAAHLGLGLSAAAWMIPPRPVVRAEMEPVAVSLEDDVSEVAARSDGREASQTGRTSAERSGLLSHRPSAPRHSPAAGRAGDDQANEARKARPRQGEPSLNWAIRLPGDVGEVSGGEGVDGADSVNAKDADGTPRPAREGQHGSGQNAAPSLGSGPMGPTGGEPSPGVSGGVELGDDRGHGAQLLPAWDCEFPSWAKVGGVVRMIATVRADGTAADAEIISDPGHGFAAVARECAMRQRFVAALDEHGKPTLGRTGPFNVRFVRH
jgi:RNA polymerase sigma-70 factor (ECF subfamily)